MGGVPFVQGAPLTRERRNAMLATTLLVLLLLCALPTGLILLLRSALLVIVIHGESMAPTLRQGDRILVLRRFLARRLRKGQVVIITLPDDQEGLNSALDSAQGYYVKRAVALAGESFTAIVSALPRSKHIFSREGQENLQSWLIPAGHVFVCGDNRQGSIDSRTWGPLPLRNIAGVMLMKLSPVAAGEARMA